MGAWGLSAFDNDDAQDWLLEFTDRPRVSTISNALEEGACSADKYLEIPECNLALVSAEVIAALNGAPHASLPISLRDCLRKSRIDVNEELITLALRAVGRVKSASELKEECSNAMTITQWLREISGLEERLAQNLDQRARHKDKVTEPTRSRRVKRKPGDVLRIDLGEGESGFGRVLPGTIAFYQAKSPPILSVEEIVNRPILFKIWVMDYAISNGIWPVIGHVPLTKELLVESRFFKRDAITESLTIYRDSTGEEIPASKQECEGLECAAVWDPEHVVDRLRDHFAGRPNKWLESVSLD